MYLFLVFSYSSFEVLLNVVLTWFSFEIPLKMCTCNSVAHASFLFFGLRRF